MGAGGQGDGEEGEGWVVFSPIMPSGTITPVTFRNMTFSPGGVERRAAAAAASPVGAAEQQQLFLPLPWLLPLPPATADTPLLSQTHTHNVGPNPLTSSWLAAALYVCIPQILPLGTNSPIHVRNPAKCL